MLSSEQQKTSPEGILIVDKPRGMTSHDVVAVIRRRFRIRRVGHAGTLDPLATGVLVILIGKATKLFHEFESFDKAYNATLLLGRKTTSADIEGQIVAEADFSHITQSGFEQALEKFKGVIEQIPPMVSAVKMNGRRLYELARKGMDVKRAARKIRIAKLQMTDFNPPHVKVYLECSKGTYVRKLAEDIGNELGCLACISEIQRTQVGPFLIKDAIALKDISEEHIRLWSIPGL